MLQEDGNRLVGRVLRDPAALAGGLVARRRLAWARRRAATPASRGGGELLFDLVHDAVLFGEGREGKMKSFYDSLANVRLRPANTQVN